MNIETQQKPEAFIIDDQQVKLTALPVHKLERGKLS